MQTGREEQLLQVVVQHGRDAAALSLLCGRELGCKVTQLGREVLQRSRPLQHALFQCATELTHGGAGVLPFECVGQLPGKDVEQP